MSNIDLREKTKTLLVDFDRQRSKSPTGFTNNIGAACKSIEFIKIQQKIDFEHVTTTTIIGA